MSTGPCDRWLPPPRKREPGARRTVAALGGDGIGPEVVAAAVRAIRASGAPVEVQELVNGEAAVAAGGEAFPAATRDACERADAVLFGAAEKVSMPIMGYLRRGKDVYANIRPAHAWLSGARSRADLVIVRELSEGMYPAREGKLEDLQQRWPELRDKWNRPLPGHGAFAIRVITPEASRQIARYAAQLSAHRRTSGGSGRVTVVTKANVLAQTDGLFLRICQEELAAAGCECHHLFVDEAARQLVRRPEQFDVIVTSNLFGDILSDVASEMAGGMPQAPSAAIGTTFAYFEPVHGSGPDIAGQDLASPIGAMMSAAMMLAYLDCSDAAARIARAIAETRERGVRTRDDGGTAGTTSFTDAVCVQLERM